MLALENKATVRSDEHPSSVVVRAQPFGGAIRIFNPNGLFTQVGDFNFDSERARLEQDFRIYVHPSSWKPLQEFCLKNLGLKDSPELESEPSRELAEEFYDTLGIELRPNQYTIEPAGILVESNPVPSENLHAAGNPTARVYRIDEIQIHDPSLSEMMIANSEEHPGQTLKTIALDDARKGGKGRANAMLVAPVEELRASYLKLSPEMRGERIKYKQTHLAGNVAAILDGVFVPKYQHLGSIPTYAFIQKQR
jgi:hypothetical protein